MKQSRELNKKSNDLIKVNNAINNTVFNVSNNTTDTKLINGSNFLNLKNESDIN